LLLQQQPHFLAAVATEVMVAFFVDAQENILDLSEKA